MFPECLCNTNMVPRAAFSFRWFFTRNAVGWKLVFGRICNVRGNFLFLRLGQPFFRIIMGCCCKALFCTFRSRVPGRNFAFWWSSISESTLTTQTQHSAVRWTLALILLNCTHFFIRSCFLGEFLNLNCLSRVLFPRECNFTPFRIHHLKNQNCRLSTAIGIYVCDELPRHLPPKVVVLYNEPKTLIHFW